jgi:acyl carrier protein
MLPASYIALERLPLTPGGKLDRAALPSPDTAGSLGESTYVAPRTHVEEVLAGLYQEILGIPRVGLHDDFFELGGHSLAGVQLLFQVREVLGVELPLRTVFQLPKVADLATVVARRAHEVRGSSSLDAQEVLDRLDDLSADEINTLLDSLSDEVEVR